MPSEKELLEKIASAFDSYKKAGVETDRIIRQSQKKPNTLIPIGFTPSEGSYSFSRITSIGFLGFALLFVTAMYGIAVTDRAELISQVAEYQDLTKRPALDLTPVKFDTYTVIDPIDGCEGLIRYIDLDGGVDCVGI